MKVTDIANIGVEQLQPQRLGAGLSQTDNKAALAVATAQDVIHLSPKAKLMNQASQIIAEMPEVRPEKVGPIQEAVSQGTYQVNSAEVAKSLIISHLTEM